MGKTLRLYGIKFGGGLIDSDNFSKILEYSEGDARRFVRNVINVRMGNHKFNLDGGLKDITTYFADTNLLRDAITAQVDDIIASIGKKIKPTNETPESEPAQEEELDPEQKEKLEAAQKKLENGRDSIKKVSGYNKKTFAEEKNDFNADFIQDGKIKITEGLKDIASLLVTTSISGISNDMQKSIPKRLNQLRKLSCEKYEEKYSAELYVKGINRYKYTNTWEELIEWVQNMMTDLGCPMKITVKKYATPEALEIALKEYFNSNNIEYRSVEIENISNISDAEADEMEIISGGGS